MIVKPETHSEPETANPRRRLVGISLLPAACTLGNLLCGFYAIFFCLLGVRAAYGGPQWFHPRLEQLFPTHIAAGAYLIILAMVFDALDGRLARITRRTSEFGAQLDSIADVVSFGIAPAALFITLLLRPASNGAAQVPDVSKIQFRIGLACSLVYVSCAAIRLARYNAENIKTESAQKAFSGLPSPGAAAAMVALLALHEDWRHSDYGVWGLDWVNISRWVIAVAALTLGLLMVSRLDYKHILNVYVRRKRPPIHLIWLILILGLAWYSFELVLVLLTFAYVLSGPIATIIRRSRRRSDQPHLAPP